MSASKYYHILRHMHLRQILGRTWFRLYRPRPDLRPAPALRAKGTAHRAPTDWVIAETRQPMMLSPTRFRFLNEEHEVRSAADWNNPNWKFLWRYNLHYFEDLFAHGADQRREWHQRIIERWIAENPPGRSPGWDPYPMSLRICNWIKWAMVDHDLSESALHSLAVQTRYLCGRHDNHLLGNHLLVNAKAFAFAGLFFGGAEADKWYKKGLQIFARQIPEQILADGGHFERSPMYHNLILEDFLDLLNLMRVYGKESDFCWHDEMERMRRWSWVMSHPDGQIVLFNDAAFGIAPTAEELQEYAQGLGLPSWSCEQNEGEARLAPTESDHRVGVGLAPTRFLRESGYARAVQNAAILFADIGPLGPDYLPGHGHADSLSFELSLHGRRVIVDSGTSIYEISPERLRQRGTAAHNALQVDGQDSSEVWSSFRVARRAKIANQVVQFSPEVSLIKAAHDGYRRLTGCGLHHRSWELREGELTISDEIEGRGLHDVQAAFHFHPDLDLKAMGDREIRAVFANIPQDSPVILLQLDPQLTVRLTAGTYHPEFGLTIPNSCVIGHCRAKLPLRLTTRFLWK